jgi:drug/metabolite transporter (DMT)-like permease
MISLILLGIYVTMLGVAAYGYFTNLEEVMGKQIILTLLLVLTGVVGILNSNL